MVVCRYYQQGNCRYGENCRNEHPGEQRNRNASFSSQNRFNAFQGSVGADKLFGKKAPWDINLEDVKVQLTAGQGRPLWILSTFGPATNSPASLLDGNELSFEELRFRFYELKATGNELQAIEEASALWYKAEKHISDVLKDIDNVVPFLKEAEKRHPNRYGFLKMTGQITKEQVIQEAGATHPLGGAFGAKSSGFGTPNSEVGSGFGSTSNPFGSGPSKNSSFSPGAFGRSIAAGGFGAPSFGQPSQPAFGQPTFGQPSTASAFGKPSGGIFGQPSHLGQTAQLSGLGASSFGQTAPKNPFAHDSAASFGHPSKPASSFGQTTQPASGFGQPSQVGVFGQPGRSSSGFGHISQLGSGFGQPSKPANGFTQPSQPAPPLGPGSNSSSGFGQVPEPAVGFGQPRRTSSGFGQPAERVSSFGQPAQSIPAFGQVLQPSLAFGQPSQPGSGFGQPSQSSTADHAVPTFGQPLASQNSQKKPSNPFGSGFEASAFGQPQPPSGSANRANPFTNPSSTKPTALNTLSSSPTTAPAQTSTAVATASTIPSQQPTSKTTVPIHYTQTLTGHNQTDPKTKRLALYKSQPVKYIDDFPCYQRPDGKGWERIWFPDGAENMRVEDLQAKNEAYTEAVEEQYRHLFEMGRFEVGRMPAVAPMREWVSFDF